MAKARLIVEERTPVYRVAFAEIIGRDANMVERDLRITVEGLHLYLTLDRDPNPLLRIPVDAARLLAEAITSATKHFPGA